MDKFDKTQGQTDTGLHKIAIKGCIVRKIEFWARMVVVSVHGNVTVKSIFHWKLGLHWLPNANEINTKNMKCTWPMQKFCVWDPMQPIFH